MEGVVRRHVGARRRFGERLAAVWQPLPPLMKAGFALLAAGGATDIGYHVVVGVHVEHLDATGLLAHLVVFAGMALSILGVFQSAVRSRRNARRSVPGRR